MTRSNFNRRSLRRPSWRSSQGPLIKPKEVLNDLPGTIPGINFKGLKPESTDHPMVILRAGSNAGNPDECMSCDETVDGDCVGSYFPGKSGPAAPWEIGGYIICTRCAAKGPDFIRHAWVRMGREALLDSLVSCELVGRKFDPESTEDREMLGDAENAAGFAAVTFEEAGRILMPGESWTPKPR